MKHILYVVACIAILSGCVTTHVSAPAITNIETDKVTIAVDVGAFEMSAIERDPQGHESYPSVVAEAQRGCALQDRDAIPISHAWGIAAKAGTARFEYLFACVEGQE